MFRRVSLCATAEHATRTAARVSQSGGVDTSIPRTGAACTCVRARVCVCVCRALCAVCVCVACVCGHVANGCAERVKILQICIKYPSIYPKMKKVNTNVCISIQIFKMGKYTD